MIDQHSSLTEKFLKKGFWLYLFSFIIAPIGYIIKIIISWELSVEEVGIIYGIISLITVISAYNDLWMSESMKYYLPIFISEKRYDKVKSLLFFSLFIQISTSIVILCIIYFWSSFIAEYYFKTTAAKEVLQIFSFFFLWLNIFQTLNHFFLAIQDTFTHKLTEFFRMCFIMFVVLYIFFWGTWTILQYSLSWLIWLYIWLILSIIIFIRRYYAAYLRGVSCYKKKGFIKNIANYAGYVMLSASAGAILSQIDMQMIIYFLWTKEAWYYTNYLSIISIAFLIIWPMFSFIFPVVSEMYNKNELSKIVAIKDIMTKNFINIGIMFNFFFFIFAQVIAYTLFWEKFIQSWDILRFSILLLSFNFLLQINFNILAGIGKVKQKAKIIFTAIIFNFLANIIFIHFLWVSWAALATGLGWILIFLLSEYYLWKSYRIKIQAIEFLKNVIIMWITGMFFFYIILPYFDNITRLESFFWLAINFSLWTIIFLIINISTFKWFILAIKKLR